MEDKKTLPNLNNKEIIKCKNDINNKLVKLFEDDFKIEISYTNKIKVSNTKLRFRKNTFNEDCNNLLSDTLPYNLERMSKENIKFLLTYYSLITLLNNKQMNNEKDYNTLELTEINIVIEEKTKEEAIAYIFKKIKKLFKDINITVTIKETKGKRGCSSKVFDVGIKYHKNNIETIMKCSVLNKKLLNKYELSKEMQDKIIFDIVLNKKLFLNILEYSKCQE